MPEDLERRIDDLYESTPDRFTKERDDLAKRLRADGDREGADRVKGLRKPLVSAWALNVLAREEPKTIAELEALGVRLRDAQRRALSGDDAGALRDALDERRVLVSRLSARTREILERHGVGGPSQDEDVTSTLEAAAVDEAAAAALLAGRLTRPMRPPAAFGDAPALTVLPGGRRGGSSSPGAEAPPDDGERARRIRDLRRELGAAEARQRRTTEAVARARARLEEADRRRADAKERLREAEAEQRGAVLEAKRLGVALSKLEPRT